MLFELEINGNMYQFKAGMAFLREVNKKAIKEIEGIKGRTQDIGFRLCVGELMDGNVDTLSELLFIANKGQNPRLTKDAIDAYIEDECEDIEALFNDFLDFLKSANCTKKETLTMIDAVMAQMANPN